MRKSLWIILAVMVVAFSAPNAHADEFQYTYTITASSISTLSFETVPIPGVTAEVDLPSSSLATVMLTGSDLTGCSVTGVILDYNSGNGGGDQAIQLAGNCVLGGGFAFFSDLFHLPLTDYTTPGTYFFSNSDPNLVVQAAELEVRAVTAPEPSSIALMLLGVGLVFVLRKRRSPVTVN